MSCAGNHDESRACDHDAAFSDYVLTRGTALLRMAIMLTGNRADAEDLVQAALAKTYRAWSKINDHAALDAYVRRAMVNTHISWWRRRRLEEFPTDELPDQAVADHARDSDMAEVVRRALDRLPQRMRTAVMLRYFEDMTEPEIAAALGISLGTVKSTVSRAVAKLRIDAELGEDSGALLFGRAASSAGLRVRPCCDFGRAATSAVLRCRGRGMPDHAPLATPAALQALLRGPEQLIPMRSRSIFSPGRLRTLRDHENSHSCSRVTRAVGEIQGLLPGARLVALSGMQVRHPEEVARCGAR